MNLNQKYRPKVFEDVCGQSITTTILKNVIQKRNFKNCYLFTGTTGTGKTTVARIFANLINNGIGDPIELDCASNGSVENIRAIIDSANQRALTSEYKIFILDECHAISSAGWQAFLKGIEETPKYTIFIFCTTEVNKVPATILNRVQRFNFTPIGMDIIKNRLLYICEQEGFTDYEQTCDYISKTCSGSMRDAITSLEQVADYSTAITLDNAKRVLGNSSYETMFKLTWAIQQKDESEVINIIEQLFSNGYDLKVFIDCYIRFILDLIKYLTFNSLDLISIPKYLATDENPVVQFTVKGDGSLEYFNALLEHVFNIKSEIKFDTDLKSTIIILLIKYIRG